ncbi:urea transporter [Pandoraea nosoerga]|uniref:Urea transporter n=1 Tax=Pandoraea nosoerga TaxID=2508296 RepID=A0A5E4TKS6_9BURK|nr:MULTISPECIES: urea transporter [Pandoraea]MBN4665548.1 urea transporter [Pandoraea nosoerga]MBN4745533.1 urea transporter [Pandoraea nosoerga]VVD88455.1 Urea transporter [Pandoraea nosoerga]
MPSLPSTPASISLRPALLSRRWLTSALHGTAASFAQIYFIPSAGAGLLLFAVLALADWTAALSGLAASVTASVVALGLQLPREARRVGLFGYNGALTGIAFSAFWQPDAAYALWLVACVCLTVPATAALVRRNVPALTGPFVGVMMLSWAAQSWLGLMPRVGAPGCSMGTPGFVFCAVGQVVFVAPLVLGLLVWYVLALWNLRATLWALAAGVLVWSVLALMAAHWPALAGHAVGIGVNAFLAALGLGAFGRRPLLRLVGAGFAALLCVGLGTWLEPLGWPYFTLPFNLAVWIVLACGVTAR